ncbi:DYRK-family kinase pom1 [Chionoecetes opilio]|uniref:DYRK-family kinase pom1 n=1 Tax=Chionoecetes opilio TaxID=41210 RepID=A0A8J5CK96_CHIOP|nr:DYRK-family kinase pom1 [Chionoecetes opilio]
MWSLGCLLAECYLGEPLFMGKSKKEILSKITELMGPFPREFNDGEYAEEFAEFIGRPMSRYQRIENLRKRLNDCKDSMFLMLVERLLTYLPDRRFTPFEAACHPFVACSTPFLYLTPSPGYIRYPTVLLDMSTYPYLPGLPDDDDEDSASAHGRKRLALFSRHKRPQSTNSGGMLQKQGQCVNHKDKDGKDVSGAGGKTATRSDVKETLKSMGLRCEDFTISVYSREQAHAILKRQGVEVTPNNLQGREKVALLTNKGMKNMKSSETPKFAYMRTGNTRNVGTHFSQDIEDEEEEDDDDCVILDPPDMPKPIPKLPQQFQLMGTTVQVNRGAKRPSRPLTNQPQAKRTNARPMMYYRHDHEQDIGPEASVQDTLKRLKNYNISITCRRNASGMRPQGGMMDSESDMENDSHMDSDDDGEDMTKYLECQIGEIGEIEEVHDEEVLDDLEVDYDDKNDIDYNPRGKKRRQNKKSPKKGKRINSMGTESKVNEDSCTSDITALVPNVEMAELSDHQASNHSEEPEQDPLGEENEDTKELRDILENAAHLQEDEEEENNHNTNQENETKEADENQETVKVDMENVENKVDDGKEISADPLDEFVEAEACESAPKEVTTAEDEEDEIDEELEKELLSGNLEDCEVGEMVDL